MRQLIFEYFIKYVHFLLLDYIYKLCIGGFSLNCYLAAVYEQTHNSAVACPRRFDAFRSSSALR